MRGYRLLLALENRPHTCLLAAGVLLRRVGRVDPVVTGTAPIEFETSATTSELGPPALVIPLAIALAGFEIPTTTSDRLRSVSRPLGWAMALVVACAATAWAAANMGTSGFASDLVWIASETFGEVGSLWLLAASIAVATAALLVLIWGATRVIRLPVTGTVLGWR